MRQYDGAAQAYATRIAPRYRAIAGLLSEYVSALPAGSRVLEIAVGTGVLTELTASDVLRGGGRWIGSDVSRDMVRMARASLPAEIRLAVADARALPFRDAAADAVVSSLGPIQESVELFAEARRVLRPGGLLAITLWDAHYSEWQMLREPRRRMGAAAFATEPVADACDRARAAGLVDVAAVRRRDGTGRVRLAYRNPHRASSGVMQQGYRR